jgi:hypothetical protein
VSEPHIRKVRPNELEEVWRVHVASSNDGAVGRGGVATSPADRPVASDARVGLISDQDGYFCAVEEGRIRGTVSALVRGQVWSDNGRSVAPAPFSFLCSAPNSADNYRRAATYVDQTLNGAKPAPCPSSSRRSSSW